MNNGIIMTAEAVDERGRLWKTDPAGIPENEKTTAVEDPRLIPGGFKYCGAASKNSFKRAAAAVSDRLMKHAMGPHHFCPRFFKFTGSPFAVTLKTYKDGRIISEKEHHIISRETAAARQIVGKEEGFSGSYYEAEQARPGRPAVLLIGGSMGGTYWSELAAARLASEGFSSLAVSYFSYRGEKGLPRILAGIDIEVFERALNWLASRNPGSPLSVAGLSKGAEAALVLASVSERAAGQIESLTAFSPPSHLFEGAYLGRAKGLGSWKYGGSILPFLPYPADARFSAFMKPGYLLDLHSRALDKAARQSQNDAKIRAGGIQARLLLISGGRDLTWPSGRMCEILKEKNPGAIWKHYPEAGHIFSPEGIPPCLESATQNLADNAEAAAGAWREFTRFLKN